ncbi:ChaN family lipoprotein [Curvibacter sp. RS43]|uniref:ChaN family lipoprotein n=1 Tax=Curvibacter microcysteis TaxID=3026419 RepID=A0ABT5MP98_9BURK|nr:MULTISPECIES: ChaN family lipoprotein [unclassified Curvibacter]MDD0811620.1 ChaN family lipoprotein [Curvibacter sp. RS43]MDD0817050.1 ChaN family lipoprotein [Curvibacter sp. HBC28]
MPHLFRLPRPRVAAWLACLFITAALPACSGPPLLPARQLSAVLPADLLLIGEQHDAPSHHQLERQVVEILGVQGRLAALALEMVEQGRSTAGLPRSANESQVRAALVWNEQGWPWADYAPAIMTAVEFGVPVIGVNLPRDRQRAAMKDFSLDLRLRPADLERQRQAIRSGHCDLLAEAQVAPMTRIQIARDLAMAQALLKIERPQDRTVVLLAGAGHVQRSLGIPVHLPESPPSTLRVKLLIAATPGSPLIQELNSPDRAPEADLLWVSPPGPARDHCADLRQSILPAP